MRTVRNGPVDRSSGSRSGGASNLGVWIGGWAILISLACLYFAIDARNIARDAERRLERNAQMLQESRAEMEKLKTSIREQVALGAERIEELSFAVEKIQSRVETNQRQLESTREVASRLIDNLAGQKEALTELATRIPAIPRDVRTTRDDPRPEPATAGASPQGPGETASAGRDSPATTTTPPEEEPEPEPEPSPTYTVKSGDTLVDIARRKGFSVPELLDANPDIDPNVIRVGQKLNLPR